MQTQILIRKRNLTALILGREIVPLMAQTRNGTIQFTITTSEKNQPELLLFHDIE